ncbi:MAG TPA: hotdog domain-containing protein [Planktothrix sp.]|jgi:acyl-CoA thioesterase YciA
MKRRSGCSVIRVEMHPQHANGNVDGGRMHVFGGIIMSFMDTAGASAARDICRSRCVTKKFTEIIFEKPVYVGDLLECYGEVTAVGNTSITVRINVDVVREGETVHVTQGEAVFVAVDQTGKPTQVINWNGKRPRIRRKSGASACKRSAGTTCGSQNAPAPAEATQKK